MKRLAIAPLLIVLALHGAGSEPMQAECVQPVEAYGVQLRVYEELVAGWVDAPEAALVEEVGYGLELMRIHFPHCAAWMK